MNNILPFAFKDSLVRVVKRDDDGDEPWFVGRDVCKVLDLRNESQALARLDPDERQDGVSITDPIGREQTVIIVSEPGVFRLIFTSRKAEAEEFKRWLAHDVLPKLRRDGFFGVKADDPKSLPGPDRMALVAEAPLASRVDLVRLAARLFGSDRARRMWADCGLPTPPMVEDVGEGEGRACLRQMLWHSHDGVLIYYLLDRAIFDGDEEAAATLRDKCGILAIDDEAAPGFIVANRSFAVAAMFDDKEPWRDNWARALRRLPGARPAGRQRYAGVQTRGTFVPARYLEVANDGDDPRWSPLSMP